MFASSASRRARKQPRDSGGRFVAKAKTAFVDESGDLGRGSGSSPYLVMTAMVTSNPERIESIGRRYWWLRNTRSIHEKGHVRNENELKFNTSLPFVREAVLKSIDRERPQIFVVAAGKSGKTGKKLYADTAETLVRFMADGTKGTVYVNFDEHSSLSRKKAADICRKAEGSRKGSRVPVICENAKAKSSQDPRFQANDFVTGAEGYRFNSDSRDPGRYHRIIAGRVRTKNER